VRALRVDVVRVGQPVLLRIAVQVRQYNERLVLGFGIKDRLGLMIYGTNTDLQGQAVESISPDGIVYFEISFLMLLGPGTYSIHTALTSSGTHLLTTMNGVSKHCTLVSLMLENPFLQGVLG